VGVVKTFYVTDVLKHFPFSSRGARKTSLLAVVSD